jgi:hypothetical protein
MQRMLGPFYSARSIIVGITLFPYKFSSLRESGTIYGDVLMNHTNAETIIEATQLVVTHIQIHAITKYDGGP